jgi:hypothetical protein
MKKDVMEAFSYKTSSKKYNITLSVGYEFKRKNPPDHKTSKGDADSTLDINYLEDCLTSK